MENREIIPVPEEGNVDIAQRLVKTGLNSIPAIGGLLAELVDLCIQPRYQKKMEEWCHSVNEIMQSLLDNGVTKEQIFHSEEFSFLFMKSSRLYLENIEAYKKPLFQNALRSSVLSEAPFDKKYIFLGLIEKLTEKHLMILKDIVDNEDKYESGQQLYKTELEEQLAGKYTEGDQQYLKLLVSELEDSHLINYGATEPKVIKNETRQWHMVPSRICKEFVQYLNL